MTTMASRERIEATFEHRQPDRTPIFEYVLQSPIASQLLGRPYRVDSFDWAAVDGVDAWERAVRELAVDRLELALRLGHDMLYVTPNPMPPGGPVKPPAPAPPPPDDPVERVRQRNANRAATPTAPPDASFLVYRCLRQEMARRDVDLPILAPAYAHGIWTDVDLMQTMVLAPEVAHEHFQLATRTTLARVERYIELGLEMIGVGGDFAGNRPLISPAFYREFIVPEVRRTARCVHAGGGWAVNASDGNLWGVIDDFLIGCEVDGYLEIDMHAEMDLGRLKQQYGGRVTFLGNLDCGITLSFGTPAEVRQHVVDCLEAGQGDGGHILCASNAITASVPLENYLALVNAYRDVFGLPQFNP